VARYGHITKEIVSKFREGDFDNIDTTGRKAWLSCLTKLMLLVYTKLGKHQSQSLVIGNI
jgi:hypothetical protein